MTGDDMSGHLLAAQEMVRNLNQELMAANNEFIALTLELEERMDQLRLTNQQLAREIAERRQVEAALQASEVRFRALVENSVDGIVLMNRQGRCVYISPSVERLLGYRPNELAGRTVFDHVHEADLDKAQQDFHNCLRNPRADIAFHCRFRIASGSWRYLEGTACNHLDDPSVQAVVVNYRDISERRRAELRIRHLNRTLERQIRLRTAELQLAFEFEASLKRITDKVRDSLDENQIMQTAVRELALAIPGSSCNASLYNLEQQTSVICYEYTQMACSYHGRVLDMAVYPELYGQLLQGETFQFCSLLPNPDRGKVAVLTHPISDDQGVLGDLWLINRQSYSFSPQDVRLVQQVANQCAIALRQAHLYRSAQAQVQELEQLNQMKDDFLSTVSHELRAPMANIKMSVQLLAIQLEHLVASAESPIHRYVKILQDECDREINLINDLLDLARLDTTSEDLHLVPIQLHQHLPYLAESFSERMQSQHQQLVVNVPDSLPAILSHVDYVDRILVELLNNACKYTPPQEAIIITAQMGHPPRVTPDEATTPSPPLPCVGVSVTNTGVEIPPQECDRIFDKFYRIPSNDPWKHGGTGLGLALVKKLAERLGGTIHVQSRDHQTSFLLTLPLQPPGHALPESPSLLRRPHPFAAAPLNVPLEEPDL